MNKETLHEIAATNDEIKRLILSVHYRRQHCSLSKYVIFLKSKRIDGINKSYLYKLLKAQLPLSDELCYQILELSHEIDINATSDYKSLFYQLLDCAIRLNPIELNALLVTLPNKVHFSQYDYFIACKILSDLYNNNDEARYFDALRFLEQFDFCDPFIQIGLKTMTFSHFYFEEGIRHVPLTTSLIDIALMQPNTKLSALQLAIATLNNTFYALQHYGNQPFVQSKALHDSIDLLLSSGYLFASILTKVLECYSKLWTPKYSQAIQTVTNIHHIAQEHNFALLQKYCNDFLIDAYFMTEKFDKVLQLISKPDNYTNSNLKRITYIMTLYIIDDPLWWRSFETICKFDFPIRLKKLVDSTLVYFQMIQENKAPQLVLNAFHNVIDSIPQMMWFEISTKLVIFMKYYSIKKHLTQLELPLMTCRLQLANGNNTTDIFDSLFNAMV